MPEGLAPGIANAFLNAIFRNADFSGWDEAWLKLNVGAPGAGGTSNAATETTRKQITSGTNASGGAISNTVALTWTSVAGSEDFTHCGVWDGATSGTFGISGTVTANAVTAGDTFTIAIGDLDTMFAVAS